jgi:alkylhydroperoxidase family enzyme
MAWINLIREPEATGPLSKLYESSRNRAGYIAQIIQLMSRDADIAAESMRFYVRLMKSPNALNAARRELLATVVSNVNDCYY